MTGSEIEIPVAGEGKIGAFVARPPTGSGPGIVLLTPIFGVTDGIKAFAGRFSRHGFVVVAPDLFWRTHPGPLGYAGSDRDKAQERYKSFDVAEGVNDLGHAIRWLRTWPPITGGLGAIGLCFGGRYAFLAAAEHWVDAAVSYHGTFIERHLDRCGDIKARVDLHFGESDPHVPMTEVERIRKAASGNRNIQVHTYAGAGHGFMQDDRPSFHAPSAELAFARGLDALKSNLETGGKS